VGKTFSISNSIIKFANSIGQIWVFVLVKHAPPVHAALVKWWRY